VMGMGALSESVLPKNLWEAIPQFLWGTGTFAFGFFAIENLVSGHYETMWWCWAGALFCAVVATSWQALFGRGIKVVPLYLIFGGVAGCLLFAVIASIGLYLQFWGPSAAAMPVTTFVPSSSNPTPQEFNLKSAIHDDFPGTFQTAGDVEIPIGNQKIVVHLVDFRDPHIGAEFLGAYVPGNPASFEIIRSILAQHQDLMKKLAANSGSVSIRAFGQQADNNSTDKIRFTGRIFIYYEQSLSLQQLAQLEEFAQSLNINVVFRDQSYLLTKSPPTK
jgi:hypothetical protein